VDGVPAQTKTLKDQLKRIPLLVRLKKAVWKFPGFRSKQRRNFITLSEGYGQFASMKLWSCVDGKGNPIPWYTYPAIEYLDHLDLSDRTVFEFGSGNSSLWWAGRCKTLTSIEDDHEWYEKIKLLAKHLHNFDYRYNKEKLSYVEQPKIAEADIVIVDGSHRSECVEYVLQQIKMGHLNPIFLVFDNSDWYPRTMATLNRELNWIQVDFAGFGPINDYTWTTSIFINPTHTSRPCYRRALDSIAGIFVDDLETAIN
jgi:hypothetical protein